ncbi:MAG: hypothetical protein H6Q25_981 [Bacteroidetes bacterium]|nr:hypothetical protein [Bacteroidota bacterium]
MDEILFLYFFKIYLQHQKNIFLNLNRDFFKIQIIK